MSLSRILIVEDQEAFRKYIRSTLEKRTEWHILGEAADGLEAVRKAEDLRPDLILLDVGLPTLNGLEAARRIRKLSPRSKILFLSQESSEDVVLAALAEGAKGYVVKTDAGHELLPAVSAVLGGKQFVSARFSGYDFGGAIMDAEAS
jgi:DNA-binding NarL/FixJ family response regulator